MAVFGFIGIGNMGGALACAAAKAIDPKNILVAAKHPERAAAFAEKYRMLPADNARIAREADYIVLGVKPQFMAQVLGELQAVLTERTNAVLVTMAAGLTMEMIQKMAGTPLPVIRIMPNTPCQVGTGLILYDAQPEVTQWQLEGFLQAMAPAGKAERLPERLIDAGSAIAGSGPAFACMFIEALADGGVACGLPRQQAMTFAAQMLLGSAQLVLESGQHPGQLKDAVCSPGGSTIQGVRALEGSRMRSAVTEAVIATYEKNREFAK